MSITISNYSGKLLTAALLTAAASTAQTALSVATAAMQIKSPDSTSKSMADNLAIATIVFNVSNLIGIGTTEFSEGDRDNSIGKNLFNAAMQLASSGLSLATAGVALTEEHGLEEGTPRNVAIATIAMAGVATLMRSCCVLIAAHE